MSKAFFNVNRFYFFESRTAVMKAFLLPRILNTGPNIMF